MNLFFRLLRYQVLDLENINYLAGKFGICLHYSLVFVTKHQSPI